MKALSLTQPWPWIIFHLGKRIENRSRNLGNYRGTLLLHAAKRMSGEDWWSAYQFVRQHVGLEAARRIPSPFPPIFFEKDGSRASPLLGMCKLDHEELHRTPPADVVATVRTWMLGGERP